MNIVYNQLIFTILHCQIFQVKKRIAGKGPAQVDHGRANKSQMPHGIPVSCTSPRPETT